MGLRWGPPTSLCSYLNQWLCPCMLVQNTRKHCFFFYTATVVKSAIHSRCMQLRCKCSRTQQENNAQSPENILFFLLLLFVKLKIGPSKFQFAEFLSLNDLH
jgi:hypothetical protein